MTLLLGEADLDRLEIGYDAVLPCLERTLTGMGTDDAINHPRQRLYQPVGDEGRLFWLNALMGSVRHEGLAALRFDASVSRLAETGGAVRKERVSDFLGLVFLLGLETAELLAIMKDHWLSTRRVAATSALVAQRLARCDSATLGVIGAGEQAREHIRALAAVLPLEDVRVYSPSVERRRALCDELDGQLTPRVRPVDSARDAVEGSAVVVTATSSRSPVLEGAWLTPGTHLCSIVGGDKWLPAREVGVDAVGRAELVVVNSRDQMTIDEQPKVLEAIEQGEQRWEQVIEVGELLRGAAERPDEAAITLHDNNTGLGIQFVALAGLVLREARRRGIGEELDADRFMTRGGSFAP